MKTAVACDDEDFSELEDDMSEEDDDLIYAEDDIEEDEVGVVVEDT